MVSFGWSVGDVVSVCVILTHIIKAFDNVKGTQKHYRDSHAFLCGLYLVVSYVSDDEKAASLPEDAKTQIQSISNAYSDLHSYILKYAKIDKPEKTRLQGILPTVRWTMNELNDKVQKMKANSLSAISIMETLIVMNLSSRVNTLLSMSDHHKESLKTTTDILTDVRQQLTNLSEASEDYQQLINDASQSDIDSDVERRDLQNRLDAISKSQNELQEKLNNLVQHAEEKSRTDQHQAEEWKLLLEEYKLTEQSEKSDEAENVQNKLDQANGLIGGMGNVTGNSQLTGAATRLGGVSSILGALGSSPGKVKKPNLPFSKGASSADYRTRYDCLPAHVRARREYQQSKKNATGPPPPRNMRAPPPAEYKDPSRVGPALPPRPTVTTSSSTPSVQRLRPASKIEDAMSFPRPLLRTAVTAPPVNPIHSPSQPSHNGFPPPNTLQASSATMPLLPPPTKTSSKSSSSSVLPPPLPPRRPSVATSLTSLTSSASSFELQPITPQSTFSRSPTLSPCSTTSSTSTRQVVTTNPVRWTTSSHSPANDQFSSPSSLPVRPPKSARPSSRSPPRSAPTKSPYLLELMETIRAKESKDQRAPISAHNT